MLPLLRYELRLQGLMPERALLRLRRAGISLYKVKKTQKNELLFQVKKKDIEKVFAIYPNLCYNNSSYHPYQVGKIGGRGLTPLWEFCQNRVGLLLGALAFCALTLASEPLVLGIEVVGNVAYRREVEETLEAFGVKPFALYSSEKEDLMTAKLLTLKGITFSSVKKVGHWVRVELRSAPFQEAPVKKESMTAVHGGELLSITALKGTALKKAGDIVKVGDVLVGNWFVNSEEERVTVEPIARAQIACRYEGIVQAESEEEAFAKTYLFLNLCDADKIVEKKVEEQEGGFFVNISYHVTETINL